MEHSELKRTLQLLFPILDQESLNTLARHSVYMKVSNQTEIISEGKRHHFAYVILLGGAKSYYLKDGKEICTWFAFENEVIGSMANFQGFPSKETIVLLEDSDVIQIQMMELKELAQRDLSTSQLLNDLLMEYSIFIEEKLRQLQFMSARERYTSLLEKAPDILQRVSLTDIASYLGVSRETLSRIRAMK